MFSYRFLSFNDEAQKYIKVGNTGELIELLKEKAQAKTLFEGFAIHTNQPVEIANPDNPQTTNKFFDNQHELSQMNHELIDEKFMDNSV